DVEAHDHVGWTLEKEVGLTYSAVRSGRGVEATFDSLVPGTYRVRVCDQRRYAVSAPVKVGPGARTSTEVAFATRPVTIVLEGEIPEGTIGGRVEIAGVPDERVFLDRIFDTWAFGEVRDRTLAIAQAPTCPLVVHLCGEHMLETLVPVPAGEEPLTLRVPVTASRSVRVELVDEG